MGTPIAYIVVTQEQDTHHIDQWIARGPNYIYKSHLEAVVKKEELDSTFPFDKINKEVRTMIITVYNGDMLILNHVVY